MQSILVLLGLIITTLVFGYFSLKSVGRLNYKVYTYYEFGKYFPSSGKWSVLFYLVVLAIFIAIVFIFAGNQISYLGV